MRELLVFDLDPRMSERDISALFGGVKRVHIRRGDSSRNRSGTISGRLSLLLLLQLLLLLLLLLAGCLGAALGLAASVSVSVCLRLCFSLCFCLRGCLLYQFFVAVYVSLRLLLLGAAV